MNIRELLITLGDWHYYAMLSRELHGMRSVLDVGCGSNSPIANVPKTFYSVGVDIHRPSITKSRGEKIHDVYKVGNVLSIDTLFKKKQFDAVVALDVIEHLPKEKGWELLRKMNGLAKKRIILLTPNGFVPQHPYDGNTFQEHLSGWTVKDFRSRSYRVYGMRGLKWLRGEYATIKWKPWFFWAGISTLSELFVFFLPGLANQLLVVKDLSGEVGPSA